METNGLELEREAQAPVDQTVERLHMENIQNKSHEAILASGAPDKQRDNINYGDDDLFRNKLNTMELLIVV